MINLKILRKGGFVALLFATSFFSLSAEWIISGIDFEIDGRTRQEALERFIDLKAGDRFQSESDFLREYALLEESIQNLRIFEEYSLSYELVKSGNDTQVNIYVFIKDTWNLIGLPYPSFDTNEGTRISLKIRDYNFLGNMETLRFNLNYIYDTINPDNPSHTLSTSMSYPFKFEIGKQVYTLTASQGYDFIPDDEDDTYFFYSELSLGSLLHVPVTVIKGRKPDYSYSFGTKKMYRFNREVPLSEERDGIDFVFKHNLSLGWTSWGNNNYREGMAFSLSNTNRYALDEDSPDAPWSGNILASGELHKDLYPWGYSGRIVVDYSPYQKQELGGYLRGIVDNEVEADAGIFMNNAIYLTVWNWNPVWEWYGGFFMDVGYLFGPGEETEAERDNLVYSLGVEGMAFPYKFRNFYARLSLGLDAGRIMESEEAGLTDKLRGNIELFFGIGAFY